MKQVFVFIVLVVVGFWYFSSPQTKKEIVKTYESQKKAIVKKAGVTKAKVTSTEVKKKSKAFSMKGGELLAERRK